MKKITALILSLIIVFSLFPASAATGKITGVIKTIDTNRSVGSNIKPGDVIDFPLTADMFSWSTGTSQTGAVTSAQTKSVLDYRLSGKETSVIKKISFVNKAYGTIGNTMHLRIEFIEEFVSVSEKDFEITLYLKANKVTQDASKIEFNGTFANEEIPIASNASFKKLGKGLVGVPAAFIRKIEIEAGRGVVLNTSLSSNKKVYASANNILSEADERMFTKYDALTDVINIKTVNLSFSGKCVDLSDYDGYVYDSNYKFLGETGLVAFSNKYYITDKKITLEGVSTGSSENSSSSTKPATSAPKPSSSTKPAASSAKTLNKTDLDKLAATAVKASGKNAAVTVKSYTKVTSEALTSFAKIAGNAGKSPLLNIDTLDGSKVRGRLTISPTSAYKNDLNTVVSPDSPAIDSTANMFNKYFKNKIKVISVSQQSDFPTTVTITAKVSLSGMSTSNLNVYSYNKANNKYVKIANPNLKTDTNGYVYVNTTLGGDIIISEGALVKK